MIRLFLLIALAASGTVPAQEPSANRPSAFTAAQAEAGRQDVLKNNFGTCGDCHTIGLRGRTGAANEIPPVSALPENVQQLIRVYKGKVPPLVGPNFVAKWSSRSTKDMTAEFTKRFGKDLTEETRLNIIAYLLQLSGALPGSEPLTMSSDLKISNLVGSSESR
jgi:cytochrome c553